MSWGLQRGEWSGLDYLGSGGELVARWMHVVWCLAVISCIYEPKDFHGTSDGLRI